MGLFIFEIKRLSGAYLSHYSINEPQIVFYCNVSIEAPGRRLNKKINIPSKMLAAVKLMYSYGR